MPNSETTSMAVSIDNKVRLRQVAVQVSEQLGYASSMSLDKALSHLLNMYEKSSK